MQKFIILKLVFILGFLLLNSCGGKLPGADAREFPADPKQRVAKNLKEGKGLRFKDIANNSGGTFEFASSNELWRASLDTIEFMPLVSANYSGGIIITDWYSENEDEAIKITLRFLSNEIRSDSLNIKIFLKKCNTNENCKVSESSGNLSKEIKKQILKKAALYEKEKKEEEKKD